MALSKVIVVGAGPSGLLLALLLARAGIPVELLEQASSLDTNPRASHYTAESCAELDRAGVLDEVRAEGFAPDGVSWRRLDAGRTRMVMIRNTGTNSDGSGGDGERSRYSMVCLPLHRLGRILERRLLERKEARIHYGCRVVDIGGLSNSTSKEGSKAWVKVERAMDGGEVVTEVREADYVVGCDGANSTVRRRLFGDDVYPGYTWKEQIVATNVYYDYLDKCDYDDSQFFVHPEHWHMVARIQTDGLTRVTYGEVGGLTYDQLKERQPGKFHAMLPGSPAPDKYKLVNFSPYKVHQRCVDKMRVGRFVLAADAAHLCNPFGGLGLTGGIADVGSLYECFLGIHTGQADDSILDVYDEVRRRIWHEVINPISTENMGRLFQYADPDEAMEKDPFFRMMKEMQERPRPPDAEGPPNPGLPPLRYDMTQHYRKDAAGGN